MPIPPRLITFSVDDVVPEINRVLLDNNIHYTHAELQQVYEYIIGRALENLYCACFVHMRDHRLDYLYDLVASHYDRQTENQSYSLLQDVGTNKLFHSCRSTDFHHESELRITGRFAQVTPR